MPRVKSAGSTRAPRAILRALAGTNRETEAARPEKSKRLLCYTLLVLIILVLLLGIAGLLVTPRGGASAWIPHWIVVFAAALAATATLVAKITKNIAADKQNVSERAANNLSDISAAADIFAGIFAVPAVIAVIAEMLAS